MGEKSENKNHSKCKLLFFFFFFFFFSQGFCLPEPKSYVPANSHGHVGKLPKFYGTFTQIRMARHKIISSNSTLDVIQVCISNGGKE